MGKFAIEHVCFFSEIMCCSVCYYTTVVLEFVSVKISLFLNNLFSFVSFFFLTVFIPLRRYCCSVNTVAIERPFSLIILLLK